MLNYTLGYNTFGYNFGYFSPPRGARWRIYFGLYQAECLAWRIHVEKEINIIYSFIKRERDLWKKDS